MDELIERLRDKADEMDRRMGVTNTQALLREAAAALEAAREESDRWRDRYRAAIDQARGKGVQS